VPAVVLDDVSRVLGAVVSDPVRLAGGLDVGAHHLRVGTAADAVLKVWPQVDTGQLPALERAGRIARHMRGRGCPTPAWRGIGATTEYVWNLVDFVDGEPASKLPREQLPSLIDQLLAINDLQAGQATEPYDHWAYSWRLTSGQDIGEDLAPGLTRAVAELPRYSAEVADLVRRARSACAGASLPPAAPDMVHADFKPDNVLVREGKVVAVVDIGNAGSGTRATDLVTLLWHTLDDLPDDARERLWSRIVDIVGVDGAAVPVATQVLTQLEFPIRHGWNDRVSEVLARGHRILEGLGARR
jgi:aminoglycoside phosphotransferase (APT) family kinase protein